MTIRRRHAEAQGRERSLQLNSTGDGYGITGHGRALSSHTARHLHVDGVVACRRSYRATRDLGDASIGTVALVIVRAMHPALCVRVALLFPDCRSERYRDLLVFRARALALPRCASAESSCWSHSLTISSPPASSNAAEHRCLGGALTGLEIGIVRGQGVELVEERLLRASSRPSSKRGSRFMTASGRCGPGAAKARRDVHGARRARFLAGCWKFMWGA
jgi:hypothetical protein